MEETFLDPVGVGYIGLGQTVNLWHLPFVTDSPLVQAVAGTDITPARRELLAPRIDGPVYSELAPLLENPAVEIAVVATPHRFHKEQTIAALEAGKHVICEKPLGLNLAEAREIAAVAERCDRYASVYQNRRFDGDSLAIEKALNGGAVGEIVSIARAHYRDRPHLDYAAQEYQPEWRLEAWAGHLIDWGPHLLNQLLHFAKSPPKSIYCHLRAVKWSKVSDDFFSLMVEFQNGVIGKAEVCVFAHAGQSEWHVIGNEGTLICKGFGEPVYVHRAGAEPEELAIGQGRWIEIYESLARFIRGQGQPVVSIGEALATMELIEAARISAQTGRSVDLPL